MPRGCARDGKADESSQFVETRLAQRIPDFDVTINRSWLWTFTNGGTRQMRIAPYVDLQEASG
jgi:hypothetical protein